jgi:hypothetical protein
VKKILIVDYIHNAESIKHLQLMGFELVYLKDELPEVQMDGAATMAKYLCNGEKFINRLASVLYTFDAVLMPNFHSILNVLLGRITTIPIYYDIVDGNFKHTEFVETTNCSINIHDWM